MKCPQCEGEDYQAGRCNECHCYLPTPEQIESHTSTINLAWSERDRRARAGWAEPLEWSVETHQIDQIQRKPRGSDLNAS